MSHISYMHPVSVNFPWCSWPTSTSKDQVSHFYLRLPLYGLTLRGQQYKAKNRYSRRTSMQAGSDTEDLFESSLFDNENYELKVLSFGTRSMHLLCSESTTTDHDLTGQILWPAATLLANYIAAHPVVLTACSCALELGAGLGLVGLLAAQSCPVVLTDHNDVVLRVLQKNADLNQAQHNIRCLKLEWKSQGDMTEVLAASPDQQGYDVILGADVCYSLNALPALFAVAARLLSCRPASRFLLGYVSRAYSIDRQLIFEAQAAGFAIVEEMGTRQQVGGSLEGVVYSLTNANTPVSSCC